MPTRPTTWTCCGTAGWAGCSPSSGRLRRWNVPAHLHPRTRAAARQGRRRPARGPGRTVPGLLVGGAGDGLAYVDVDDTIREVHGHAKQGAAFGYSGVRGLNLQLATISTPLAAPVIARARLRKGNTASHTGAGRLLAQALRTAKKAGVTRQILVRADSAYYGWAFVGTAIRHKAWVSVTARMNPAVVKAITTIAEDAWVPIEYPNAVFGEDEQRMGL